MVSIQSKNVVWHDGAPDVFPSSLGFLARFSDGSVHIVDDKSCFDGITAFTFDYEIPSPPCSTCFLAEWNDLYGVMCYCCDMSHCINAEEEMI